MCFLEVKGRQHHLSQNTGPAIAGSAGPVPPTLGGKGLWGREEEGREVYEVKLLKGLDLL